MHPILTLLLTQLSERLVVSLLLQILEQVRPLVADTNTQLDDTALNALINALKNEQERATNGRPGNGGEI